jgi:hypothetical protein
MSKRTRQDGPKESSSIAGEPTPPFLSEQLIAQLQGAVNAAQRKRMRPHSNDKGQSGMGTKPASSGGIAADPPQN